MRDPRRSLAVLATAVLATVALASGCGSGDGTSSATRGAAADTSCSERSPSEAKFFTFVNDLDTDVTLEVPRDSWECSGYSGVSTPGNLNGRTIGHPGPQPRIRMEIASGNRAFTMAIKAGQSTLATLDIDTFPYPGDIAPWGILVDGRYRCSRPVVELKDQGSTVGYLTMTTSCFTNASGDAVFQLTKTKPTG